MATQAPETRSSRVVVLVSRDEKQRITANAAAADMSLSDFMRTAAERYSEPSEVEQLLMRDLLAQLETANARTEKAFAALEAARAQADGFDEETSRAQARARILARDDIDWDALGDVLSGSMRQ